MKRKPNMPQLVYIGLLGINSKNTAYFFVAISVLVAVACIFAGLKNTVYFYGVGLFLLSAFWYYFCINWVDNNATWDD